MKRWLLILKIVIMVGAYGYLAYALITFDKYPELINSFCTADILRWLLLVMVFVLMPLNIFFESCKWRSMVSQVQSFSLMDSFKSVLMGMASGFFTPNRICDPVGRVLTLDSDNRAKGVMFYLVGSVAQSFAICLSLILPALFLATMNYGNDLVVVSLIMWAIVIFIVVVTLLYFTIPLWAGKLHSKRFVQIDNFLRAVDSVSYKVLLRVSGFAILRYIVFSLQYYLALKFMAVDIDPILAVLAIPLNYFLVTITPSIAFSELGVRGLYAYIIIGMVSMNPEEAAVAASLVWFINNVIPMIAGSVMVSHYKE